MTFHSQFRRALLALAPLTASLAAAAEPSDDIAALRAQVQQLAQQLTVLSRKLELQEEAAAAAAPTTPKVTVNDKGVTLASADNSSFLKLRGLVQLDSRLFFGDGGGIANNQFVLRRARLITEGQLAKNFSYQFVTDFGGGSVSILDANFTVALNPALAFKIGKFKVPLGLELLQSDSWTFFSERSLVTNLVPNRDLGIQAAGELFNGRLSYQAGVFGGVPDGASSANADVDNDKDGVARVVVSPFRNAPASALQGLSLAIAGSVGREKTATSRASAYRTDGQQTFFAYNAAAVADGRVWRVSPQFDYRNGPLGVLGEYVVSTVNLRPAATGAKTRLRHRGWELSAGYVLTGEDSSYNGVVPRENFDWDARTWGAFEVVGRFATLDLDDQAFPTFASAATNADEVRAFGFGVNWYLSKTVEFKIDYFQNHFGFAPHAPAVSSPQLLRQDEKAFITRFQLSF